MRQAGTSCHTWWTQDTTGAGDAFSGARGGPGGGMSLDDACRFANAAAAISVTRVGTGGDAHQVRGGQVHRPAVDRGPGRCREAEMWML